MSGNRLVELWVAILILIGWIGFAALALLYLHGLLP